MSDSLILIGTFFPMCPRSILLEKQMKSNLEGKTIIDVTWEKYYTGQYSWHGDNIPGLEKMKNQRIIFADASNILTENGMLAFFAYADGGIRYYVQSEQIHLPKIKKSVSHAYYAKFKLDDGSCLVINLYGWGTFFKVFNVNTSEINTECLSKSKRYPFIPKPPIDITDEEDFSFEKFQNWLLEHPNANIIESCATAKGAFRIDNPVMNYILLISKIHPRTKTRVLSDNEICLVYSNTKKMVENYKSGIHVCKQTDIFGNKVESENDILWMNSASFGKPCPICGTPIEAAPIAGTKMYFCPNCQIIKKT